jgi:UDP-3-O-[3-hydroxymyristoyl] glucosamine N-acyltransferase
MERTLKDLATFIGGQCVGNEKRRIAGVRPFETADHRHITFAVSPQYLKRLEKTSAGAVIVPDGFTGSPKDLLWSENPYAAFAKIFQLYQKNKRPVEGIHASAVIGEGSRIGDGAAIGPMTAIGNGVSIGPRVAIFGNVHIGDGVVLGDDVRIYPNVTILDGCVIGSRVIIHAGSVIGSDGFGFAPDGEVYHKIPHVGIVRIEDDVEIGAANTIDRGTFGETRIGSGVKTDNLVHIAHNVHIGDNTLLVAQVGISGSTTIGRHSVLAGQVGVVGHIHIGDNVMIGAQSGVGKSVPDGSVISGSPAMSHKRFLQVQTILPRLPDLRRRLAELERRLDAHERSSSKG